MSFHQCVVLLPWQKLLSFGVRPIVVGGVLTGIISRSIRRCIQNDMKVLGTNQQLCLDQKCGIEQTIHSLRNDFETAKIESSLLIDTKNAFNSLNRALELRNIENLCPSIVNFDAMMHVLKDSINLKYSELLTKAISKCNLI